MAAPTRLMVLLSVIGASGMAHAAETVVYKCTTTLVSAPSGPARGKLSFVVTENPSLDAGVRGAAHLRVYFRDANGAYFDSKPLAGTWYTTAAVVYVTWNGQDSYTGPQQYRVAREQDLGSPGSPESPNSGAEGEFAMFLTIRDSALLDRLGTDRGRGLANAVFELDASGAIQSVTLKGFTCAE